MKIKKLLIPLFVIVITIVLATLSVSAYIHRQRWIEGKTKIGTAKVISVINQTKTQKVSITEGTHDVNISVNLNCNIDTTMRVKVAPKFYDINDRLVIIPNIIQYNFDQSLATWEVDENNMCFYFNALVKNIDNIKLINSISFNSVSISTYEGYSVELVVEVDILQHKAVDYNNHPWKENAPSNWIESMKNL